MVAGLVRPDVTGALLLLLRNDPDVTALCSQNLPPGRPPRIAASFPESTDATYRWVMPDFAIVFRRAGGQPPDLETGRRWARFDFRFYGPGAKMSDRRRLADLLYRTADPVLCPPMALGLSSSSQFGHTIIQQIYPESEGFPDMEPGTDWPLVNATYVVEYQSQSV